MAESDKPEVENVRPPAVPIQGITAPDPAIGGEADRKGSNRGNTGHEAFEKAKAETERRR